MSGRAIVVTDASHTEHIVATSTARKHASYKSGMACVYSICRELAHAVAQHSTKWARVNSSTNEMHVREWLDMFISQPVIPICSTERSDPGPQPRFTLSEYSKRLVDAFCAALQDDVSPACMAPMHGPSTPSRNVWEPADGARAAKSVSPHYRQSIMHESHAMSPGSPVATAPSQQLDSPPGVPHVSQSEKANATRSHAQSRGDFTSPRAGERTTATAPRQQRVDTPPRAPQVPQLGKALATRSHARPTDDAAARQRVCALAEALAGSPPRGGPGGDQGAKGAAQPSVEAPQPHQQQAGADVATFVSQRCASVVYNLGGIVLSDTQQVP